MTSGAPSGDDDPVELSTVRVTDRETIRDVTELHRRSLGSRFSDVLGARSLHGLYEAVLGTDAGVLVVATQAGRLRGFVLATTDTERVPPAMMRWPHRLAWTILFALMRRRGAVLRWIEATSGGRTPDGIRAELMLIAVEPTSRSRGIGSRLVARLDRELGARGVNAYKVIVGHARTDAIRFYERNGFRFGRTYSQWGVEWDVYLRRDTRGG